MKVQLRDGPLDGLVHDLPDELEGETVTIPMRVPAMPGDHPETERWHPYHYRPTDEVEQGLQVYRHTENDGLSG